MQNINIKNPQNCDFNSIKKEITQTADGITTILTYPNGFVMKMIQTADGVNVQTSRPLIDNGDGTYVIPE